MNAGDRDSTLPPLPSRDDRFIGDFRLVRKLGEGGMGVIYEAEQQHPHRPVALKVIRGGAHVSADTLKLFQREAQTLAHLRHPGIAALHLAATLMGMDAEVSLRVAEVKGRAVSFDVEVHDGLDKVGQGRHARFVTDVKKTEERLAAKAQKAKEQGKLA